MKLFPFSQLLIVKILGQLDYEGKRAIFTRDLG